MSLPLVRGYPAVFSISQAAINEQYANAARTEPSSRQWSARGEDWRLDALVENPYINFSATFPQCIQLNYLIGAGTFEAVVVDGNDQLGWRPYKLDGVVFSFITPARIIQDSHFQDADLTAQSLFIDLDSPHLRTVVETSSSIETDMPDDTKATVAQRVQDYVRQLAQQHPNQFIIATSLTAGGGAAAPDGCLEPTAANFSVCPQFDAGYPETDPWHSERSTVNWLLSMPAAATSSGPEAGILDGSLVPANKAAAMTLSGFAVVACVVMPAVAEATGIPTSVFTSTDQVTMRTNGRYGDLDSIVIYPAGDHIQVDYSLSRTKKKDIVIESVSVTVTATWSTNITFRAAHYQDGPVVQLNADNTHPVTHVSGHAHIFGISMPSFVDDLLMDIAKGIAGAPTIHTKPLQALTTQYLQRFRVLGGQYFGLDSAQMVDGNLVLGLLGPS